MQLHSIDTDSFVLSFDADDVFVKFIFEENVKKMKQDVFESSELERSQELCDSIDKKWIGKMKIENHLH